MHFIPGKPFVIIDLAGARYKAIAHDHALRWDIPSLGGHPNILDAITDKPIQPAAEQLVSDPHFTDRFADAGQLVHHLGFFFIYHTSDVAGHFAIYLSHQGQVCASLAAFLIQVA